MGCYKVFAAWLRLAFPVVVSERETGGVVFRDCGSGVVRLHGSESGHSGKCRWPLGEDGPASSVTIHGSMSSLPKTRVPVGEL